jgi:hypothetical protein
MDKDPTGPKDKIIKFCGSFRNRKKHLDDISSLKHFKLPDDFDLESELEAAFQKLSPEEKAHVENSDDDAFFTFPPPPRHYPRFLVAVHCSAQRGVTNDGTIGHCEAGESEREKGASHRRRRGGGREKAANRSRQAHGIPGRACHTGPTWPTSSLLGQISDTPLRACDTGSFDKTFFVGTNFSQAAQASGRLFLARPSPLQAVGKKWDTPHTIARPTR